MGSGGNLFFQSRRSSIFPYHRARKSQWKFRCYRQYHIQWLVWAWSVVLLAILGVVAAPITSGDTAFRSARLIVADFLHMEQRSISKRLLICIPLFLVAILILIYNLSDRPDLKKFGDILRGVIKHWLYSPFGLLPYIYPEKGNLIG